MADESGEEIRDEIQQDLDSVLVAAISYVYVDEDGDRHPATARFCLHDDDADPEEEMMDHLKVDIGLQHLNEDSILNQMGGGNSPGPGVVAMSAEEAEEAGILGALEEMMGEQAQSDTDEDDADDDPMFF